MSLPAAATPVACLLCALLCVSAALQHSDVRLISETHNSFFDYSCSQEPQPCSMSSLAYCRSKEIQLSPLHRPRSPPVLQARRLTVWFTSPMQVVHLLNNSEVRHLTLVHCGPGEAKAWSSSSSSSLRSGYFTVQHLERVTVVTLQQRPVVHSLDGNRARSSDSYSATNGEGAGHLGTNRFGKTKYTNAEYIPGLRKDSKVQDILLGREQGAAYYEQARLAVVHSSVLELGALVKAYTVLTHIDSHGTLPFPELQLPKLPETSTIYVSFVYWPTRPLDGRLERKTWDQNTAIEFTWSTLNWFLTNLLNLKPKYKS